MMETTIDRRSSALNEPDDHPPSFNMEVEPAGPIGESGGRDRSSNLAGGER